MSNRAGKLWTRSHKLAYTLLNKLSSRNEPLLAPGDRVSRSRRKMLCLVLQIVLTNCRSASLFFNHDLLVSSWTFSLLMNDYFINAKAEVVFQVLSLTFAHRAPHYS